MRERHGHGNRDLSGARKSPSSRGRFEPDLISGADRGFLFFQLLEQRVEASVPAQGREVGIVPHSSRVDRAMLGCLREKADRLLDVAEGREIAGHVVEQDRIVRIHFESSLEPAFCALLVSQHDQ